MYGGFDMLTLFREGGFSMFFILGFGFVGLGWAAWYAAMGRPRRLGFVRGMMAATLFSTAMGVATDLGTVFKVVSGLGDDLSPARQAMGRDLEHRTDILLKGLSESMAPAVMGFALLAVASLLLAVGAARTERDAVEAEE
jgi:hypothetical protein